MPTPRSKKKRAITTLDDVMIAIDKLGTTPLEIHLVLPAAGLNPDDFELVQIGAGIDKAGKPYIVKQQRRRLQQERR